MKQKYAYWLLPLLNVAWCYLSNSVCGIIRVVIGEACEGKEIADCFLPFWKEIVHPLYPILTGLFIVITIGLNYMILFILYKMKKNRGLIAAYIAFWMTIVAWLLDISASAFVGPNPGNVFLYYIDAALMYVPFLTVACWYRNRIE